MHKTDFQKLLSFYLDCLEEEDMRSLSFNVGQVNQSFILGGNGSFLLTSKETQFSSSDSYFWKRHETSPKEPEKLFLGYPILVQQKMVSPLFFLEVNIKSLEKDIFSLTIAESSCFLNHHLFGKKSYGIEGSLNLQDELECDLSTLEKCLSKALKYLDVQLEENAVLENQELINLNETETRWTSNFLLFRGGRSAVNAMLRKDITTFLKYPKFIENINGTALEALLKKDLPHKLTIDMKSRFSALNADQQKAINTALSQKLTVITGPPGTGKSQVVANILAACALSKKTVLFASKNNKAVDVVYEKLRLMLDKDNWLLRLGNREKIEECQERIIAQLGASNDVTLSLTGINESLLAIELTLADISNKKSQLEKQQTLLADYESSIYTLEIKLSLLRQDNLFLAIRNIYKKFFYLLKLKYFYFERNRIEKMLLQLPTTQALIKQINIETEKQIILYRQKLRISWSTQIEEKRPRLFALCRRYFSAIQKPPHHHAGWKQFSSDFITLIDSFYIWIVTNLSARKSIPLEAKAFDLVVIDEASQCDILSALPLLYRAKCAIIIGDPHQLKNITLISAKKEEEIAKKHQVENLLADWSYKHKSIYDLAESRLLNSGKQPQLLSFHYRCHPDIIGFSNNALYENKLSTKTDLHHLQEKFQKNELGLFWHNIKGSISRSSTSAYNQNEVDYIISLIEDWRPSLEMQNISVGIVTPFKKQVDKLKVAIDAKKQQWGESFISSIVIGTAHHFQGDECDLIFFSPVIASGIKAHLAKWVASTEELLNVAITRARGAFHVVGDESSCREAGFLLEKLVTYIQHCRSNKEQQFNYESPAEEIVGEILSSLELPFFTQVEKGPYRLDFIVTTPFGNKINLEVDGRQHHTSEHISKDEIRDRHMIDLGYKVMRINAKDVFTRRDSLKKRFSQLV